MNSQEKIYKALHLQLTQLKNTNSQYKTEIDNFLHSIGKIKRKHARKVSFSDQPETPPSLDFINHILSSVIELLKNPQNVIHSLILNIIELKLAGFSLKEPLFEKQYTFLAKNLLWATVELPLLI